MRINNTRFTTWNGECKRAYFWNYIYGGIGIVRGEPRAALHIGHGFHEFLRTWYRDGSSDTALEAMRQDFLKQRETYLALGDAAMTLSKEEEMAENLAGAYVEKYPKEDFTVVAPEMEGSVPLGPDGRHRLFFRLDAVILWNGELWMMEHKTARATGPNYFKGYMLDSQVTAYVLGASRAMQTTIVGALLNVIKKTKLDVRKKESREAWIDRTFEREPIPRTSTDLERFERTIVGAADDIEQTVNMMELDGALPKARPIFFDKHFPMNTRACTRFGICPYFDLCLYGENPGLLSMYVKREPDYVDIGLAAEGATEKEEPANG